MQPTVLDALKRKGYNVIHFESWLEDEFILSCQQNIDRYKYQNFIAVAQKWYNKDIQKVSQDNPDPHDYDARVKTPQQITLEEMEKSDAYTT